MGCWYQVDGQLVILVKCFKYLCLPAVQQGLLRIALPRNNSDSRREEEVQNNSSEHIADNMMYSIQGQRSYLQFFTVIGNFKGGASTRKVFL